MIVIIKYGLILFLFTLYTASQPYWNYWLYNKIIVSLYEVLKHMLG